MTSENLGYALTLSDDRTKAAAERVYLKPMSLYVPDIAAKAVSELMAELSAPADAPLVLTVTNNNNGVSVDKDFDTQDMLRDAAMAADAVKDLINIVRGYESDEETNVCGW